MSILARGYLVVGSSSILAQAIIRRLLHGGHSVTGVFHTNQGRALPGLTLVPMSALAELPDEFEVVFCISAYIPRRGEVVDQQQLFAVNVQLPEQLCARFPKAKIVYASSVSVYGRTLGVLTENSPCLEPNAYGLSKLWGETIVRAHPQFAVVRIASMYGPGMQSSTFLPKVVAAALAHHQISLFGTGERRQNYIHADDAAQVLIAAASAAANDTFLAADRHGNSNLAVAQLVSQQLSGVQIQHTGTDESASFDFDATHTFNALLLPPSKPLAVGLCELIEWNQKLY